MLGIVGWVLRLIGPVSVRCDWARQQVMSISSTSGWQHNQLSKQIRTGTLNLQPTNQQTNKQRVVWSRGWLRLACFWDVKQATANKQTIVWSRGWLSVGEQIRIQMESTVSVPAWTCGSCLPCKCSWRQLYSLTCFRV